MIIHAGALKVPMATAACLALRRRLPAITLTVELASIVTVEQPWGSEQPQLLRVCLHNHRAKFPQCFNCSPFDLAPLCLYNDNIHLQYYQRPAHIVLEEVHA